MMKPSIDKGLLLLRLCAGGFMLFGHGWSKLTGYSQMADSFPDPLGIGSFLSYLLCIFAEVIMAALVTIGFYVRLAVIPLIINMSVAGFIVHASDPWQKKELAFMYLALYIVLFFTGSGKYSVDHKLKK